MPSPLDDPERLRRWKRHVLDKGRDVALALEKLMNGLDVRLEQLGAGLDLGKERDKRARLRGFLDQLDRVIKSFDAGTYGRCRDCGIEIDELRLDETPWTERCASCFQKAVQDGRLR